MKQVRSFLAWVRSADSATSAAPGKRDATGSTLVLRRLEGINIGYVPRRLDVADRSEDGELSDLYLGDTADLDRADFLRNNAAGVPIRYDTASKTLQISTSIVGMPPLYLFRGSGITAITSDIHLLLTVPGVELELDPVSVVELGHIGHPVEHRSLFRDLTLVQSGARLTLDSLGHVTVAETWQLPEVAPLTWPQFLEAQIDAFTRAVRNTRLSESFLSLTAGLDTRTVFSKLAADQRLVPAATMSGPRLSLDALTARRLCRAYGVEHLIVSIGDDFRAGLTEYMESASLLSGGTSSLDQAPEVYLYHQLGARFHARLSGNLGNQVGRGGTEGVSTRGASSAILDARFRAASAAATQDGAHWLLSRLSASQRARLDFILRNETVFTSGGNYSIGNHFAAQQTPYSTRDLIETLAQRPTDQAGSPSASRIRMRLRDLRHRFLGEAEERSFQRKLVRRAGGAAAEIPVNWGWRPTGGVSPAGTVLGGATLVGMLARAKGWDDGMLRRPLAISGLPSLHDFRDSTYWLRDLSEYVTDLLTSRAVREASLFDSKVLQSVLDNHFSGRNEVYHTVVFALDIALAHRMFCQRPSL